MVEIYESVMVVVQVEVQETWNGNNLDGGGATGSGGPAVVAEVVPVVLVVKMLALELIMKVEMVVVECNFPDNIPKSRCLDLLDHIHGDCHYLVCRWWWWRYWNPPGSWWMVVVVVVVQHMWMTWNNLVP